MTTPSYIFAPDPCRPRHPSPLAYVFVGCGDGGSEPQGPIVLAVGYSLDATFDATEFSRKTNNTYILLPSNLPPVLTPDFFLLWVSDALLAANGSLTSVSIAGTFGDQLNNFIAPVDLTLDSIPGKARRSFNKVSHREDAVLTLGFG